jgi:hypothetical protein
LLDITVVVFKVLPLGSYAPMPAPSPPFKTILELVLWNGLKSCRHITPDVIKMPSFQYFLYLQEQKKVTGGLHPVNREGVPAQVICLLAKNFLTDSALIQALTLSRDGTPKRTQMIIDAAQKETAIDQQHGCEMMICQCHQTILSTAAMASTWWRVRELYCQTSYTNTVCYRFVTPDRVKSVHV